MEWTGVKRRCVRAVSVLALRRSGIPEKKGQDETLKGRRGAGRRKGGAADAPAARPTDLGLALSL